MPKEIKKLLPEEVKEDVQEEAQESIAQDVEEQERKEKLAATGVKLKAVNNSAVEVAEMIETANSQVDIPSLFIEAEKRIRVTLEILFDPTDGKPLLIAAIPQGRAENTLRYLKRSIEWMEFSHPSYDDMVNYRRTAMTYDKSLGQFVTDPVRLRLCFIRFHLIDWSLRDKTGDKVELKRTEEGLTGEAMMKVGEVTPALMDVVLTEFEKDTLLGV